MTTRWTPDPCGLSPEAVAAWIRSAEIATGVTVDGEHITPDGDPIGQPCVPGYEHRTRVLAESYIRAASLSQKPRERRGMCLFSVLEAEEVESAILAVMIPDVGMRARSWSTEEILFEVYRLHPEWIPCAADDVRARVILGRMVMKGSMAGEPGEWRVCVRGRGAEAS